MSEYVVELKHITKRFPGVVALKDMSIGIRPGEIHGLIGENGAGKSTLIKVLTGVHTPEEGEIFVDGQKVVFKNPVQSREAGIACVYQELNIVKQLPVTDNVFMGRAVKKGLLLDYPRMHAEAEEALKTLGHPEINVHLECGKLGVGQQQMVEIAKAVSLDAKLIIMDEPTSSLGKEEIEQLMETVRGLKAKGVAILFVSHKLEELFELCDRVTVMRDGKSIQTLNVKDTNREELVSLMVGRKLNENFPPRETEIGDLVLEAKDLCGNGVENISFQVHAGEILGFAGLVGTGRTETLRLVYGADKMDSGEVYMYGKKLQIRSPKQALAHGIALVPEDRKLQGVFLHMSIKANTNISILPKISRGIFVQAHKETENADQYIKSLRIRTPGMMQLAGNLSGGNQQKVALAKALATEAKVLILDEPTRGIDVGAKMEIYQLMRELSAQGMAIIMISSEMDELLGMSDRIVVMSEGRKAGELSKEEFNQERILNMASGE